MKISVIRTRFGEKSTHGLLFVNGVFFGYTLEDIVRMPFNKVKCFTAIRSGDYPLALRYSPHFRRDCISVLQVRDFDGILIHEGNSADDSAGCILVGFGIALNGLTQSKAAINELESRCKAAWGRGETITLHICDSIFQISELENHCPISLVDIVNRCW